MKKIDYLLLVCLLFSVACADYLDVVPGEFISEEDVYDDIKNAERVLARLYNAIPNEFDDNLWGASDDAWNHWEPGNQLSYLYNQGSWGPVDNPLGNWTGRYSDIRRANLFIQRIEGVPLKSDQLEYYTLRIPRYKAEARFLRALFYFDLFKRYGAVPIVRNVINDLDNPEVGQIPRNPVDEVVEFICSECSDIAGSDHLLMPDDYLLTEPSQLGRITKGAALALIARTRLYHASPLFNGNTMYANIKNPDGKQLFNQTADKHRWKLAADAAKAVIDLNYYSLHEPNPNQPVDNYAQLFYSREWNETILAYSLGNSRSFEGDHFPDGDPFNGHGKMSIFQELVDAYETKNGLPINEDQTYTEDGFWNGMMWDGLELSAVSKVSNMYKDRDPRFYASIFFQYSNWAYKNHNRPVKLAYFGRRGQNTQEGDSDGWPYNVGTHNMTGYGMRKWNDPKVNVKQGQGDANRNFPVFRYAEILLNYAEALNEWMDNPGDALPEGYTLSVYDAINQIRDRVSMERLPVLIRDADYTKEGMRARIRNERRIELVFEGHRFWDVRRWMIAADHMENGVWVKGTDNKTLHGMNNLPTKEELQAAYPHDPDSETAGVAVFYKRDVEKQPRVFTNKHYLFPIPKSEIDKNPNMVQNHEW